MTDYEIALKKWAAAKLDLPEMKFDWRTIERVEFVFEQSHWYSTLTGGEDAWAAVRVVAGGAFPIICRFDDQDTLDFALVMREILAIEVTDKDRR